MKHIVLLSKYIMKIEYFYDETKIQYYENIMKYMMRLVNIMNLHYPYYDIHERKRIIFIWAIVSLVQRKKFWDIHT